MTEPRPGRIGNQITWILVVAVSTLAMLAIGAAVIANMDPPSTSYAIPAGTGARIAAGEKVDIMPSVIELHVGDHLVIRNDDSQTYIVGPLAVRAGETVDHRFDQAGTFIGACALGSEGQLKIIVT